MVRLRSLLGPVTSTLPVVPFSPVRAETQIRTLVMQAADKGMRRPGEVNVPNYAGGRGQRVMAGLPTDVVD